MLTTTSEPVGPPSRVRASPIERRHSAVDRLDHVADAHPSALRFARRCHVHDDDFEIGAGSPFTEGHRHAAAAGRLHRLGAADQADLDPGHAAAGIDDDVVRGAPAHAGGVGL